MKQNNELKLKAATDSKSGRRTKTFSPARFCEMTLAERLYEYHYNFSAIDKVYGQLVDLNCQASDPYQLGLKVTKLTGMPGAATRNTDAMADKICSVMDGDYISEKLSKKKRKLMRVISETKSAYLFLLSLYTGKDHQLLTLRLSGMRLVDVSEEIGDLTTETTEKRLTRINQTICDRIDDVVSLIESDDV